MDLSLIHISAAASGDAKKKYQANVAPGDLIYADTDGNGYITAEAVSYTHLFSFDYFQSLVNHRLCYNG